MSDFIKKKRKTERKDIDEKIVTGLASTESAKKSIEQAAIKFKKPDSYKNNRTMFDSGAAKKQLKVDAFKSGKSVIDPYTNKKLELTKKAAKSNYGSEWQEHLAESDHIDPLEKVVNEHKDNPWLSTKDIKNLANDEDNMKVISRKLNNAKRSRSNEEFINDDEYLKNKGLKISKKKKQKAIEDGKNANKSINRKAIYQTGKNILSTGHSAGMQGAKDAGATAVTMVGIKNIVACIKGEKNPSDAIEETIYVGGKSAATGYAMSGGLTVVSHTLSKSSSKFVQGLVKSNLPGQVITVVMATGGTLMKYANGEINTKECLLALGESGVNTISTGYYMAVGQAAIPIPFVGAAIGALVGSALSSYLYEGLMNSLSSNELEHQERLRIMAECEKATEEAKAYRVELQSYLDNYFKDFKDCFDGALNEIDLAFQSGNSDGVISGANKITKKLGGKVNYETVEEFKFFIDDDTTDIL